MQANSLPILDQLGSVLYSNHCWYSIFTCDDGSVGHQSANFVVTINPLTGGFDLTVVGKINY